MNSAINLKLSFMTDWVSDLLDHWPLDNMIYFKLACATNVQLSLQTLPRNRLSSKLLSPFTLATIADEKI